MKIDGYSTRRINKNMYRIVDHNGTPVGSRRLSPILLILYTYFNMVVIGRIDNIL